MKANEIMNIMNEITYGFKDHNDNNIMETDQKKWDNEFYSFYYLLTPEELLEKKCGVCWDQVELERKLFLDNNISIKTFFIYLDNGKDLPSHTFLIFKQNNKYYWFEYAWSTYKGIHEYENEEELLNDVILKFKCDHKEINKNTKLYLYEYEKPNSHISCEEFYNYIKTQKLIIKQ